jgi:hypothetical protein
VVCCERDSAGSEIRVNYEAGKTDYWRAMGAVPSESLSWRTQSIAHQLPPPAEDRPCFDMQLPAGDASLLVPYTPAEFVVHSSSLTLKGRSTDDQRASLPVDVLPWLGEDGADQRLRKLVPLLQAVQNPSHWSMVRVATACTAERLASCLHLC